MAQAKISVIGTATTVYNASATSISVTAPAGDADDLLLFFAWHDDYVDRPVTPTITGGSLSWSEVGDGGVAQSSDAVGAAVMAAKDTGVGGVSYTYGTLGGAEQIAGTIVRLRLQDLTTPVDASEAIYNRWPGTMGQTVITNPGDIQFLFLFTDDTTDRTPGDPLGYTKLLSFVGGSAARAYLYYKIFGEDDHPYPVTLGSTTPTWLITAAANWASMSFVISAAVSTATISGVTKDKDGNVVTSTQVYLQKETAGGDVVSISKVTSDGATGAYTTPNIINDTDAKFFLPALKTTGDLQGISDRDVTPGDTGVDMFMRVNGPDSGGGGGVMPVGPKGFAG